ncbi:probable endochitinase [Anopheles maculipalpis]|uniref:probable endochitinase n=1 Tax=Anopheles maculipalpis TaxID=1496333 RepID=UPI002158DC5E|nr:probable endochitinase [Anopheles maculipalpis]
MALSAVYVALTVAALWAASGAYGEDLNSLCDNVRFGPLPHPSDCRLYVMCVLYTPVVLSCPGGYVFHPDVQFCVQESQYRCDTEASISTTTPEPTSVTTEPECERRPSWESFFCDDVQRTLVTNPMNCTQYIHCQSNPPRNHRCPVGTLFNDLYQDCLPGDTVSCALESVSQDFCGNRVDGSYAHPYQCNRFVSCVRQQTRLESCPPFFVFDAAKAHCVKGSVLACSSLLN